MTFFDLKGRKKTLKKATKYLINWDKKSLSKFQTEVKKFLFDYWKNQFVFEEMPVVGSRSRFDIYNASQRIVVEAMGMQHSEFNKFFHRGSKMNFLSQIKRDLDKIEFCKLNDITLVEFTEKEFYNKTRAELEQLFSSQGVNL